MDNFYEQIVRQKLTPTARSTRLVIIMFCPILAFFILLGILNFPPLAIVFGLGGFAIAFGLYRLFTGFETEYEYIFTNGELNVDKISAKRKRQRVLSVKIREADANFRGKPLYCGRWYDGKNSVRLHFSGTKSGDVTLYFDPDGRMKEWINIYLKHKI